MNKVKEVVELEVKYRGKWVKARGIYCLYTGRKGGICAIEGVTSKGYVKLSKSRQVRYDMYTEVLRYKEGGKDWEVVTGKGLCGLRGVSLKCIDVGYILTGQRWNRDDLEVEYESKGSEGGYIEVQSVRVKTREGLERLMEEYHINYKESGSRVGVYVDDGVSMKGISKKDILCIGSPVLYISEEQASEIKWGSGVRDFTREFFKPKSYGVPNWKFRCVYIRGSNEYYEICVENGQVDKCYMSEELIV